MYWGNKIRRAARVVSENSEIFTAEDFYNYMPQFSYIDTSDTEAETEAVGTETEETKKDVRRKGLIPEAILNTFLQMANANILQARWFEKWKYASALYVAHYVTLYLQTYKEESKDLKEASEGKPTGLVSSTSLGDASISYDNSIITQSLQKWGIWAATTYGQQLVNEAKLIGIGGAFII